MTAGLLTLGAGPAGGIAIDLLVILTCAGIAAIALTKLRIAVIPGYLIGGILFGPYGVGLVDSTDRVEEITSIATVLLMFSIGMHLDMSSLRRGAVAILTIGALSTIATTFALTGAAMLFGLAWPSALAIGMALSMSSTAVVLRLLQSRRELFSAYGRTSFGILLVQDLLVIIMLAVLPALATTKDGGPNAGMDPLAILKGVGFAIASVAAIIVVGRLVLPRVMRFVAGARNDELMLVVAAAAALGAAVLTGAAGLSPELGAFIAGFLLSATPFRHHLSGQMAPLRDLFMAVFFTVVGMRVDPIGILPVLWAVGLGVVVVLILKSVLIACAAWVAGAATPVAARTGLALGQGGEFSLLVLTTAASLGLVSETSESVVIAVVVATLVIAPIGVSQGQRVALWFTTVRPAPWFKAPIISERPPLSGPDDPETPRRIRVIVAGFGPVGRACGAAVQARGDQYRVVELNARTVWSEADKGVPILYGDVTNREVLENAGVHEADVIVFTMPDGDAVFRGVRLARSMNPDARILVRAAFMQVGEFAKELGADESFIEETAVANAIAGRITACLEETDQRA